MELGCYSKKRAMALGTSNGGAPNRTKAMIVGIIFFLFLFLYQLAIKSQIKSSLSRVHVVSLPNCMIRAGSDMLP